MRNGEIWLGVKDSVGGGISVAKLQIVEEGPDDNGALRCRLDTPEIIGCSASIHHALYTIATLYKSSQPQPKGKS